MAAQLLVDRNLRRFAACPTSPLARGQAGVARATAVAFAEQATVGLELGSSTQEFVAVEVGTGLVTTSEHLAAAEHSRLFLLKPLFYVDFGFLSFLSF